MATKQLWCSFCGKEKDDVRILVAGPQVYICDECVDICYEITNAARRGDAEYLSWQFAAADDGKKE